MLLLGREGVLLGWKFSRLNGNFSLGGMEITAEMRDDVFLELLGFCRYKQHRITNEPALHAGTRSESTFEA